MNSLHTLDCESSAYVTQLRTRQKLYMSEKKKTVRKKKVAANRKTKSCRKRGKKKLPQIEKFLRGPNREKKIFFLSKTFKTCF